MIEPVEHSVQVSLSADRAFELFVAQLDTWWPREYTWSRDVLQQIGIEAGVGGLCFEYGPVGFRCDWGRVLAWEEPHRLVLAWQVGPNREPVPDPARASTIDLTFTPDASGATIVRLVHWDFQRHGDDAKDYRAAMASPQGWPHIMQQYVAAAT